MNEGTNDSEMSPSNLSQERVLMIFGEFSGRLNPDLDYDWDLERPSAADNVQSPEELARLIRSTQTYDAMVSLINPTYGSETQGFNRYFVKYPRPGVEPRLVGGHEYKPKFEGSLLEVSFNTRYESFNITYSYPEHATNKPEIRYKLQIFPDTVKDLGRPESSLEDLVINTKHAVAHIQYHLGLSVSGA